MKILGIDEVGRGPIAGPLVVAGVILPEGGKEWFKDLKDSKQLTRKRREKIAPKIWDEAKAALGWVYPEEIDKIGMGAALRKATLEVVKSIEQLHEPFDQIIIDGNVNYLAETDFAEHTSTLVKADIDIREVSAASIVAKVARDGYMLDISRLYPGYGFERNSGYGTKEHLAALEKYGVTEIHRRSFDPIKTKTDFQQAEPPKKDTTSIGARGEDAVARFLMEHGHIIVARNFRAQSCEIDIVSTYGTRIYFTEVRYRTRRAWGDGFESITKKKMAKMEHAEAVFMKMNPQFEEFNPMLAVSAVEGSDCIVKGWVALN